MRIRVLVLSACLAQLAGCGRLFFQSAGGSQLEASSAADSSDDARRSSDAHAPADAEVPSDAHAAADAEVPSDAHAANDSTVLAEANPDCPGFVLAFNNHCYYANIWTSEWNEFLGSSCNLGGTFATFTSLEESEGVTSVLSRSELIWLGLNDRQAEGVYVWSNGEPVTFVRWKVGEPDNGTSGTEEDCVAMDTLTGEWETRPCTDAFRVLCEFTL